MITIAIVNAFKATESFALRMEHAYNHLFDMAFVPSRYRKGICSHYTCLQIHWAKNKTA